jgi:hypothetical protein
MTLLTGTPIGNVDVQEDVFLEGAPNIYFQDYTATPLHNPDGAGFYWGMSGTTSYPAFEVGCPYDVSLTENLTMNDVMCDTVGVKDTISQRNYIEFTFSIRSFFPFQTLSHLLSTGAVTEDAAVGTQTFGIGPINNNQHWMVYCPKVYDTDIGDFVVIHLHKARFMDAWTINMSYGTPWQATGLRLRGFADTTKPSSQQFATIYRYDPSAI